MSPQKVIVQCGIKSCETHSNSHLFWPVLESIPISFQWTPPKEGPFSLLFTSKTAVQIFANEIAKILTLDLSKLEHWAGVGPATAQLMQKEILSNLLGHENKPIFFPKKEGLMHLLTDLHFKKNSCIFIFTASNGRTQQIIQNLSSSHLHALFKIIPVYKIEIYQSLFLDTKIPKNIKIENTQYIFHCSSGSVLRAVVENLKKYYSCENVSSLPPYIYFSVEKQSAKNEIQAFGLIDRLV